MNKEKKNKKPKLIIFLGILVGILTLVQLGVSYYLATLGEEVRGLEIKITQLQQENDQLIQRINQISSLSDIVLKAQELGFVRSSAVLHLTPQISVALK